MVFIIAIVSLAAVLAWWTIYIHNSIKQQRFYQLERLDLMLNRYVLELNLDTENAPTSGILENDDRFEIGSCSSYGTRFVKPLSPAWPELCLEVRPEILEEIEKESKSLNFMLLGESGLLLLIVLISSVFLYRFIRLERQTTEEVKRFWERSAHEIKTPITGIKAFLQNLKSNRYSQEELLPYVDLALVQVEKQEQLAENVLSGYQLESQKKSSGLKRIDLVSFLSSYFEKAAVQLTEAEIIEGFKEIKEVAVRADEYRLGVILDNIVDNALKYCSPGLVLDVGIEEEKKRVAVIFRDNGPGFSSHFKENIFSAYKFTDGKLPEGKHGAGIGLYISRQLARSMGGDLRAESEGPGEGAAFFLFLQRV